jgi:fumarate reductase flavoprotein subunit
MRVIEVPKKWYHETDIVIVGGGTGGLPAGIVVAEAGEKATVLESRPQCGGSFAMLGGSIAIAGSDEQKEKGIDDGPETLYDDMVNIAGADPKLAKAFVDNQLDCYRMIKDTGFKFPGLVPHPGHTRNRCLGWIGGYGPKLVKLIETRARERGVEILLKHRAIRLITNPQTGRVIGLKVDVRGEIKNFKAKRAVILATGGFGQNREMVAEYAPHMVDCFPKMPVGHQGDGLKMGLDVGAATKDIAIAVAPSWPICAETHSNALWVVWHGGIMVNANGDRFHNESSSESFYGPMTGSGMRQPGGVYWVVFNDKMKAKVGTAEGNPEVNQEQIMVVEKCKQYKADTIEELARNAGIDTKGLKETVAKYNSDIDRAGYDTVFGRKAPFGSSGTMEKLDTPKFYAIKCITSTTSMKGGLKIDTGCHVINNYGELIPGLYAVGEVTGGLFPKTYLLGIMSSFSFTQGMIAARNAVKEPAW